MKRIAAAVFLAFWSMTAALSLEAGCGTTTGYTLLYEVRNAKEGTLAYPTKPVEDIYLGNEGGQKTNGRSSWTDESGAFWRVVGQFATLEAAQNRQTELEAEKLAWTVFNVTSPEGDQSHVVRRAPKEHPLKLERPDGSIRRVAKRCKTEADARAHLARLEAKSGAAGAVKASAPKQDPDQPVRGSK